MVLPRFMSRPLPRLLPPPAVALVAFLALAFAVFANTWASPTHHWIGGDPDPPLFIWHLRWLPFALADGHNPLHSNFLNYPDGFNLMWNTSVLFPALVLTPVTLLSGAVLSYNVLVTLSLALSAWCAYLVFRRYVQREAAAGIGGLLYGFSPFMFAQAGGHPHMSLAVYPPLALLLLDEILVRQRRSPYLLGVLLGLATGLQLLTGEEIVALSFLVASIGVVLLGLLHRSGVRPRLPFAARAIGVAVTVALALDAYPLYVQLRGGERLTGPVQPHNVFVLDLLQFVVPGYRQQFGSGPASSLFNRFSGPTELGGYIGVPLLALILFVIVSRWSDPLVRLVALLLGAVVILSLGPRLHVAGHVLSVPLPWVIPQRLPLFESILPARLALLMFLLLGLLLALFVDRFPVRTGARKAVLAVALVVALAPLFPALPYPTAKDDTPRFFSAGASTIPKDSVALISPFASPLGGTSRPMVWQAAAADRFLMPEGYIIRPGARFDPLSVSSPLFKRMIAIQAGRPTAPLSRAEGRQIRCQLESLHVETIVVGPMLQGRDESIRFFRNVLRASPLASGGVQLWPNVLVAARGSSGSCA
ncbi:MAG: hypothetical protein QOG93_2444 [Gaiellaceae bacterium]|nr:hypothetical protein [Gaiellaceae bacterium]